MGKSNVKVERKDIQRMIDKLEIAKKDIKELKLRNELKYLKEIEWILVMLNRGDRTLSGMYFGTQMLEKVKYLIK